MLLDQKKSKRLMLTVLFASSVTIQAYSQRGAVELSLGGGVGINSNPGSNMVFKGDKLAFNYVASFNAVYNIHRSICLGLDVRATELSRKADNTYNTWLGPTIGGNGSKFVYAKTAMSVSLIANGKYNTNKGYFYGGGAAGYAMANHEPNTFAPSTESYRAPTGGKGPVIGAQAGYTHGISRFLAINFEGALRNYTLSYAADAPELFPPVKLKYNITAYAVTVGLKLRIMPKYKQQNDIPPLRGKGRSKRSMRP